MIGQPISRVDGPVKVTGRATYAYEYRQDKAPLYGVIVTATIGRGRVLDIDVTQAERSPGFTLSSPIKTSRIKAPVMSRTPHRTGAPARLSPVLMSAIMASRTHWWLARRLSKPGRRATLCA
jgi:CO/xanthine dehydrogenase Mo-binding subunit